MDSAVNDTRLDMLVRFTKGGRVEIGDHKWHPIAHGVVRHIYRDRDPVEMDILEAVKTAGPIKDRHDYWESLGAS